MERIDVTVPDGTMTWTDPSWKCDKCGVWVKPTEDHVCGTQKLYEAVAGPDMQRIAQAMERMGGTDGV